MKVFDKKWGILIIIIILSLVGVLLYISGSYAKPNNIPEIISFSESPSQSNSLKLVWNSDSTDTIEVMNNTTQRLYRFEGASTYTFQNLINGKAYEVMIRACNRTNNLYDCTDWSPLKSAIAKNINNGNTNNYTLGTISLSTFNYVYDGRAKTPSVIVSNTKGLRLVNGSDYSVIYQSGRINVGTYRVRVIGKGNYSFDKSLYFKINPICYNTKVFSNKRVLILGDSISANYGKFTEVAAKDLGGVVTNRSLNGRTIAYVPNKGSKTNSVWYDVKTSSFYVSDSYKKHKIIIIAAGTNDYTWNVKEKSISTDLTKKSIGEIISMLRKNNSDSKIIIVTPIRRWDSQGNERAELEKYRNALKEGVKGYKNVIVINGTDISNSNEFDRFLSDTVHPKTDYAQRVLAPRLECQIIDKMAVSN